MIDLRREAEIMMQESKSAALSGRVPRRTRLAFGRLTIFDIVAAVLLSGVVLAVAGGWISDHNAGPIAACGVLGMTVPVAWRWPAPVFVAGIMAAAALANGLLFGPLVRCGVALPAFLLVVFAVGAQRTRALATLGLALCVGGVVAEGMYDPQIEAPGLAFVLPLLIAFFAAGWLVQARVQMATALRSKSAELRRQREQNARLAVFADRAEISADLEHSLHEQIGGIAGAAATGLDVLDTDHGAAREALAVIERDGRQALEHMRDMLSTLRAEAPSEPQPTLARLPELLATATTASARLTIEGIQRVLPAGLELSGYRIIEHLLEALEDTPAAAVDVVLRFSPYAVELHVSGPSSVAADLRAILAAAAERASLHSGTVRHQLEGGFCHASATLPLVSGLA